MKQPKPRQAGRAILRDRQGRVLLIHFVLPNMTFWATPGGGMEPGETPLAAALREVREELGIDVVLEGPVHQAVGIFEFEGVLIENTDNFFVGKWDGTPRLVGATQAESAALTQARWWTVEEMERTQEDIFPRDLAAVLRRLG
jgi:8-oxo-dGTP pyrophosphatase MutT (NUDIX family)